MRLYQGLMGMSFAVMAMLAIADKNDTCMAIFLVASAYFADRMMGRTEAR